MCPLSNVKLRKAIAVFMPYSDPLRDFAAVTQVATGHNILVVHPSVPAKSVQELIALAKAIAMAELEIAGEFRESKHEAFFDGFGEDGLDPQELASFPDYLVCVNAHKLDAAENSTLMEILSAGLPMKILVQTDDILAVTTKGQMIRVHGGDITSQGRNTMGVRIIALDADTIFSRGAHIPPLPSPSNFCVSTKTRSSRRGGAMGACKCRR